MASITSLSNSASSIYGSRNVLSGLASGMDTESMIENAVSGIKLKIQNLVKKRTKVEWKQEGYRSIIDKAVSLNQKYTSYSSKTNLLSSSFFSNAVNTVAKGTYADKITATGKSSSEIKINAVKQMAKAATYTVSGLGGVGDVSSVTGKDFDINGELDLSTVSGTLTFQYGGKNGTTFDINFDELENLDEVEVFNSDGSVKQNATSAEKLAQAINNKLGEITYNYTKNGFNESTTADKAIKVTANADGRITFTDGLGNGNTVKISSSSGNMEKYAGENVLTCPKNLSEKKPVFEYLGGTKGADGKWSDGKELGITFNGVTKRINMSDVMNQMDFSYDSTEDRSKQFKDALQKEIDNAFGAKKITVNNTGGKLSFKTAEGSTLSLGGSAVEALGFETGDSNFINPSKKLTDILGKDSDILTQNRLKGVFKNENSKPTEKKDSGGGIYYVDDAGNRVDKDGFRLTKDGKSMYDLEINGTRINVDEDTTLEGLMNAINSNADAGVKVSYSKLTNEFKFTATETGANSKIEFGGLAKGLFVNHNREANQSFLETYGIDLANGESSKRVSFDFGKGSYEFNIKKEDSIEKVTEQLNKGLRHANMTASFDEQSGQLMITDNKTGKTIDYKMMDKDGGELERPEFESSFTTGQDAIMDVEINGKRFEDFSRSTNSFDIDGLTINVKGEFEAKAAEDGKDYEPITFESTTDSDKIIDAIKEFVNDYNEMVTELKSAYSTMPAQKSNGSRYEPLTAEEEEGYSESELKAYNEKAKQGILFGDTTLSAMYNKLRTAITPGGSDGQILREIGIGTSYSDGLTTISLDEDKLRAALDSNPDKVKNAFTKTVEGGSSSDGLMQTLQNTLNTYVKTTGEPKGVLITHAGSIKAPTSLNNNSLKSQIDNYDKQIDRWQDKMADQIDRYTTKFSKLEQLIAEMNAQSSSLMGLMGGSSGGY